MSDTKQIIITLNAKALFDYFPKKPAENDQCFKLDFSDPVHSYVVTQEITREDCPLFHQIYEVLKKRQGSSFQVTEKTLYDKFLIVDFQDKMCIRDRSAYHAKAPPALIHIFLPIFLPPVPCFRCPGKN